MRLLSFDLSRVSIQGHAWVPNDRAKPGTCQIHLRGSSCAFYPSAICGVVLTALPRLFVRLIGIKPSAGSLAMETDDVVTQEACAPTFNMQDELVSVHVCFLHHYFHSKPILLCESTPQTMRSRGSRSSLS